MARRSAALLACVALAFATACTEDASPADPIDDGEPPDTMSTPQDTLPTPLAGGATTILDVTPDAYHLPAPNLAGERIQTHHDGKQGFETRFVAAPAGVDFGLGPLFNDVSCEACHVRGSRTRLVRLLRVSSSARDAHGAPAPLLDFGVQIQDRAVQGFEPEARVQVVWETVAGAYPDGTAYTLRRPTIRVLDPYKPFDAPELALRTPRPVFGLGLLEAVPESALDSLADAGDSDGDGISGRKNVVWDLVSKSLRAGRFGWKAEQPSLLQQIDAAYLEDMGVTTSLFPVEATAGQEGGEDEFNDDPELPDEDVDDVVFFVQTIAVPARRDVNDPQVREGEALFESVGCAGCHVPSLATATLDGVPEVSGQTIFAYTDLLLHDMGDDLSDGRPSYLAEGAEWRTPPLWGLGLAETVARETEYLHDGRARSVEEAILWHGGEAQTARDAFRALTAAGRAALLRFLASL